MAIIMTRLGNFCVFNMTVVLNFNLFDNGASVAQGMMRNTDKKHEQLRVLQSSLKSVQPLCRLKALFII